MYPNVLIAHYAADGTLVMEKPDEFGGIVEFKQEPEGELTVENAGTAYTDRLYQWDYKLYNRCCMEVWGNVAQYWDDRKTADIERFLSLYTKRGGRIRLLKMTRYTNQANGFPVWSLDWQYLDKA